MFKYFVKHAYKTYFADGDSFNIKLEEQKIEITKAHALRVVDEDKLRAMECDASSHVTWGFTDVGCSYEPLNAEFGFREGDDALLVEYHKPIYKYICTSEDGDEYTMSRSEMVSAIGDHLTSKLEGDTPYILVVENGETATYEVRELTV